jgi:hypothetical protein
MKGITVQLGFASVAALCLTLASTVQALPPWTQPRSNEAGDKLAARQYMYDPPPPGYGGYYTYGGYGPEPTLEMTSSSTLATSESSGEETSSVGIPSGQSVQYL